MIPADIRFRDSRAEIELFESLRDLVSNKFTALHHVPWASADNRRRTVEGEADFVIVHPDLGALVLEVKAGTLRYESSSAQWYQTSRSGRDEHRCADPFRQAANGARAIVKFLEQFPRWRRGWGPIGFAVCFPDATFQSEPTPAIRPELVLDARHLRAEDGLERRLREVMEWYPRDQFTQGGDGASRLVAALNHDVMIEQPLGVRADLVERRIAELSSQQYRILRYLKHRQRLAVSGPAGSGKTLLALERARDAAAAGLDTLLLTYNRPLADYLARQVAGQAHLRVASFHQLCRWLAATAGIRIPADEQGFFQRAPDLAIEALGRIGGQFDAILVDEGQVMEDDWWIVIEASLREPDSDLLWVFYDDNQALYSRPRGLPPGLDTQPLLESWRSSRQIFDVSMGYYDGEAVECLGPDGPEVEFIPPAGPLQRSLSRVLHRLIIDESLRAADIAVLTPRAVQQSGVLGQVGAFNLTETPVGPNDVRLSSIRRFLGLEAQVVVLCELPPRNDPDYRGVMYVGLSRARAHLVVFEVAEM
jgi:hypothetical protein